MSFWIGVLVGVVAGAIIGAIGCLVWFCLKLTSKD